MPYNGEAFQRKLVTFTAPTLMSLKLGSLFSLRHRDIPNQEECLSYFNRQLADCGIRICILKKLADRSLVYVYHEERLRRILKDETIHSFLQDYSYQGDTPAEALATLSCRLEGEGFPHEIGIFLGYPLYDVQQFIKQEKSKCVGCWKVYGNKKNALKKFDRFDCCTREMMRRMNQGENLLDTLRF